MNRKLMSLFVLVIACTALPAQSREQKAATIKFVQELQTPDGGFAPVPQDSRVDQVPRGSLRATSSALRALKYFGGKPKDNAATAKFIQSCYDAKAGAFADQPGGKPDVFSTAVGLMAVVEAGLPVQDYAEKSIAYMAGNAKEFEDIRIAAAGFETAGSLPDVAKKWRNEIHGRANADGTFGRGATLARSTGGSIVTILRLGGKADDAARIIATLNAAKNADGAWGKDDSGESDLETSYRVMRCFHMLKAQPKDSDRLRAFIAKCRNDDAGYGVKPGQASNVGGVYFAAIVLHWLGDAR